MPLYTRFYAAVVGWTLRWPWVAVSVAALMFGGSTWLFDRYVTRGVYWGGAFRAGETYVTVRITLPRGSSLERLDELVGFFEAKLATMPEVERYTSDVSEAGGGNMRITFPDSLEDTFIPLAIKEEMFAYSTSFTGAQVNVQGYGNAYAPSFYGGGGGAPNYAIDVFGYNYEKVREIAEELGGRFEQMTRIEEVDTNASGRFQVDRATEYAIQIDRDALARHDVSTADLVYRLDAAIGGRAVRRTVKLGGEEVDYSVKLAGNEQADVLALLETLVTMPDGRQVRLGDVVSVAPRNILASVLRENQQYKRTIAYEFRGPVRLGDAVRDAVLARTELPPGYSIKPAAGFGFTPEDRRQIYLVLAVSVLLIYMVTAATFESLRQPLCVLLSIPMGLIGTFLTFFYTNATFTREAYIGVIMSGGIVVNNAILLVAHINALRERPGTSLEEAALHGTLERVRPILMTSATTILGMLPLVLFSGSNDNIWNALAFTLIGGMISSTLLVLTVTPALYVLFERKGAAARVRVAAAVPELAPAGD